MDCSSSIPFCYDPVLLLPILVRALPDTDTAVVTITDTVVVTITLLIPDTVVPFSAIVIYAGAAVLVTVVVSDAVVACLTALPFLRYDYPPCITILAVVPGLLPYIYSLLFLLTRY